MTYKLLRTVIEGGVYDKTDILNKMDFYLLKNRITQKEYVELEQLLVI